jgi:hypothetical protein
LVMKSEYMPSHSFGRDTTCVVRCVVFFHMALDSGLSHGETPC